MRYVRKLALATVASVFLLSTGAIFTTQTGGAVAAGTYTYDPRRGQPSRLFVENRPELVLLGTLQQQIARDGTYPRNARTRIRSIEPTKVVLYLRTDWQAVAQVTTTLSYDDGTERSEVFEFHSINSKGFEFPLLPNLALHNTFGRLKACEKTTATRSICRVD